MTSITHHGVYLLVILALVCFMAHEFAFFAWHYGMLADMALETLRINQTFITP